jgi:glycerophosphoryl diester phosphodiesterase
MRLPFFVKRSFRIIAHRGASAYAPENTMSSFQLALDMGIREIELDTQLSLDREVVICHGLSLDKYGYDGYVEDMNWNELSVLDMGTWFSPFLFHSEKMLRLQDLFSKYGKEFTYHIEIKGKAEKLPNYVCKIIDDFNFQENVVITCYSFETLQQVKILAPYLKLGWLIQSIDDDVLFDAQKLGLFQICPRANLLNTGSLSKAHSVVSEIRAWGINGKREEVFELIDTTISSGCDGTTINWPDWIKHEP